MIVEMFPSKKKPVEPFTTHQGRKPHIPTQGRYARQWLEQKALERGITADEYLRRDTIIKSLVEACLFAVGQVGYPYKKKDYEKFGALRVRYFTNSLDQLPKDEVWPTSDNPLIMSCERVDGGGVVTCTTNFLTMSNLHLGTATC